MLLWQRLAAAILAVVAAAVVVTLAAAHLAAVDAVAADAALAAALVDAVLAAHLAASLLSAAQHLVIVAAATADAAADKITWPRVSPLLGEVEFTLQRQSRWSFFLSTYLTAPSDRLPISAKLGEDRGCVRVLYSWVL